MTRSPLVLASLLMVAACSDNGGSSTGDSEVNASAPACMPTLECAAPDLPEAKTRPWRHFIESNAVWLAGAPMHRGRDFYVNTGAPQTVIAKFAYSLSDVDLYDEEVDVFVQRDCGGAWEKLGTTITTSGGHPTVEGVEDFGGRVYYEIPADKQLGPGRHRIRLVVAGDNSSVDLFLDVVPPQTPIFVSDVDGTLTSSEHAEWGNILIGTMPDTHVDAPEALSMLARKGYRPMYITARPEQLTERTREFLATHGFPPGIIHTSTSAVGAGTGASAAAYKAGEIQMLAAKGLVPAYGFGNMPSDSQAYATIAVPDNRIFYQIEGDFTGKRINEYTELLPAFTALPHVCR